MPDLLTFCAAHWVVLLEAVLIGATVRMLKADTVFPITVKNKRWYAPISIGLGVLAGILDHLYYGTPWRIALVRGFFAGFLPIVGHDVVVKGVLGALLAKAGLKDVPVGKLLSVDGGEKDGEKDGEKEQAAPVPPTEPAAAAEPAITNGKADGHKTDNAEKTSS